MLPVAIAPLLDTARQHLHNVKNSETWSQLLKASQQIRDAKYNPTAPHWPNWAYYSHPQDADPAAKHPPARARCIALAADPSQAAGLFLALLSPQRSILDDFRLALAEPSSQDPNTDKAWQTAAQDFIHKMLTLALTSPHQTLPKWISQAAISIVQYNIPADQTATLVHTLTQPHAIDTTLESITAIPSFYIFLQTLHGILPPKTPYRHTLVATLAACALCGGMAKILAKLP